MTWTTPIYTMKTNKKDVFAAVITAAGTSRRMKSPIKKEYLPLSGRGKDVTVLSECLFKFLAANIFESIIVTVPENDLQRAKEIAFSDARITALLQAGRVRPVFTSGGSERRESVFKALLKLRETAQSESRDIKYVLVHDGARPFLSINLIERICADVKKHGAVVPACEAVDTQKIAAPTGEIITHLKRSSVYAVQTPQAFCFPELLEAHRKAALTGKAYTDDSELYSEFSAPVFICQGEPENKKITFQGDI